MATILGMVLIAVGGIGFAVLYAHWCVYGNFRDMKRHLVNAWRLF